MKNYLTQKTMNVNRALRYGVLLSTVTIVVLVSLNGDRTQLLAEVPDLTGSRNVTSVFERKRLERLSNTAIIRQRKPLSEKLTIEGLAIEKHRKEAVLICQEGKVWLSKDGGKTWNSPIFDSDEEEGVAVAFNAKDPQKVYVATNRRLLMSTNEGKDWTDLSTHLRFKWRPLSIVTNETAPDRIYVATKGNGVLRSDDGGRVWDPATSGLPKGLGAAPVAPIESIVVHPSNPNIVYVVAELRGVYKTTNGGQSWTAVNKGLPNDYDHRASPWRLSIDPQNPDRLLLWASWPVTPAFVDQAFFLSKDGAESWTRIADALNQGNVFDLHFVDSSVGIGIADTENGPILITNEDSPS